MANRKPLVLNGTQVQNIQAGDTLDPTTYSTLQTQSVTNGEATAALVIGAPAYLSASATAKRAQANAALTTVALGLVSDASIAAAAVGNVALAGPLTATTAQWDAVTGGSGGLTPGSAYYVDPANAGKLTATGTSTAGQYLAPVGRAISSTVMAVAVQSTILL